ncbi:MAG: TetR/AcrR family transcriptional regulator [Novosphingobium sp.]|nr:TetR/AcrR family transcriptional regulator [Novosphingobium sp.]
MRRPTATPNAANAPAETPAKTPNAPQAGRRDKHDHVIPVAVDLFAERGYDNVTMDEIAAASGISRRSLFRHFRQKEEFLGRWMLRFNAQLCAAIVHQPDGLAPLDVFRSALDDVDEIGSPAAERLLVLDRITSQSPAADAAMAATERKWENAVAAAFGQRADGTSDAACRIAAALGFAGLRLAVAEWVALPAGEATQPRLARILDTAFAAIRQVAR